MKKKYKITITNTLVYETEAPNEREASWEALEVFQDRFPRIVVEEIKCSTDKKVVDK